MAELIGADTATKQCVVPHLDVQAAARVIAELVSDDAKRRQVGDAFRRIGKANFNMNRYVSSLDALGNNAVKTMRQRAEDFATLRDDPLFDANFFSPFDAAPVTRSGAIINFLAVGRSSARAPAAGRIISSDAHAPDFIRRSMHTNTPKCVTRRWSTRLRISSAVANRAARGVTTSSSRLLQSGSRSAATAPPALFTLIFIIPS